MNEYLIDGESVDHDAFVARALDPSTSCVVEACAGSGKTWLLVGRMLRLLLDGVAPGRILAITFTRRAAQEMRQRLNADLAELARAEPEQAVKMLRTRGLSEAQALRGLPAAQGLFERVAAADATVAIDTFHGWFWRLVQSAPLSAGAGYAPTLLEQTGPMLDEAWEGFCRALLEPRAAADRQAYERLMQAVGDDASEQLLRNFVHHRAQWWSFAEAGPEPQARACEAMRAGLMQLSGGIDHPARMLRTPAFTRLLEQQLQCWRAARPAGKLLAQAAEALARWCEAVDDAPDRQLMRLVEIFYNQKGEPRSALDPEAVERKLVHAPELQAQVRAQHGRVLQTLETARRALQEWDGLQLTSLGLRCGELLLERFQQAKRRAAALDFTDLEWQAHRLLRDPDLAAYMQTWLDARYRHLLLDEFQDTSPLQWQVLLSWLASYEGDAQPPGVFLVGDPKQSIYRFRGAEPRVFEVARNHLVQAFGASSLRTNITRRNAPQLVAAFNRIFTDANPLYQPQGSRAGAGAAAGARVLLLARTPRGEMPVRVRAAPQMRDVLGEARSEAPRDERYREGMRLAQCIREEVARLRIAEGQADRAARWSDVLVLVRRRTHLADLERALRDSSIPFLSARRGSLLHQLEIEDLLALLGFLSNRNDDLQLARALRSPLFACAEEDLVALAQAGGASWWLRLEQRERAGAALERARRLLRSWLPRVGVLPVHDLLDAIVYESDARAAYAAAAPVSAQAQVQANIDALLELALTQDSGRFPSPVRFLAELETLRDDEQSPAHEGLASDENAVRLLTIHAAKGLEAPIVVLPDTHFGNWQEDRNDVLLGWPPEQPAPLHFSLVAKSSGIGSARAGWVAQDRAQREQEDWNLLYVAMTRARQVLVISGVESGRPAPGSWYERIASRLDAPGAAPDSRSGAGGQHPAAAPQGSWQTVGTPPQPSAAARRFRDFRPEALPTGSRVQERASEAMRLGSAWHAVLQRLAAGGQEHWSADALARTYSLSREQAAQAIQAARAVVSAPGLRRWFAAPLRSWNEIELLEADGGALRIDRLVEFDDCCWILDYKWQLPLDAGAVYGPQLHRYARVLAQAGIDKPMRLLLIGADAGFVEVAPEAPGRGC